jgi:hypothetical protein
LSFLKLGIQTKNHEQWMALCEQASKEQDPKKLALLIAEILRLSDEKQHRLDHLPPREQPK